jgi:hypothetical protein
MKRIVLTVVVIVLAFISSAVSQQNINSYVDKLTVVTSQLGFREQSPKTVTLLPAIRDSLLPEEISFYVHVVGARMKREQHLPKAWTGAFFNWPFDIDKGKYVGQVQSVSDGSSYKGTLRRVYTRWGTFWQGDFTQFTKPGVYQIETEYGFTTPFVIESNPYNRLIRRRRGFDLLKMPMMESLIPTGLIFLLPAAGMMQAISESGFRKQVRI